MSLELKNSITLSEDAVSFRLRDTSIGWGTDGDPDTGDILAAVLGVTGQHLDAPVYIDIFADWADYISADGLVILASQVDGDWTAFPDGYYEFKLYINEDGDPIVVNGAIVDANVDFSYLNSQGFMKWARNYWRQLPVSLDFDNFDYAENRDLFMLKALIESAESAGAVGRSFDFATLQDTIAEQFNDRGIAYAYNA